MKKIFLIFAIFTIIFTSCSNQESKPFIKQESIYDIGHEYICIDAKYDTLQHPLHMTMLTKGESSRFDKTELIYHNDSVTLILEGETCFSQPHRWTEYEIGKANTCYGNLLIDIITQSFGSTPTILEYDKYGNWVKLSFIEPEKNKTIILYRIIHYF